MAELERNIIPYGEQNFATLRKGGFYYVDKTPFIRELELRSSKIFFVRPRRMGKSLFVDMLARYYDLAAKRAEALAQLRAYSDDPALASLTAGTPTTYLYIHYKGFDQIACEEVDPAAAVL